MSSLTYVTGDATQPVGDDRIKLIPHIVNDIGAWGSGFVIGVSNRWPEPEAKYRQRFDEDGGMKLGETDLIAVNDNIIVANMCAQHMTGTGTIQQVQRSQDETGADAPITRTPIRYGALAKAMVSASNVLRADKKIWGSIHAPMFGAARAGGHWPTIEALILELWVDEGFDVTIYKYQE